MKLVVSEILKNDRNNGKIIKFSFHNAKWMSWANIMSINQRFDTWFACFNPIIELTEPVNYYKDQNKIKIRTSDWFPLEIQNYQLIAYKMKMFCIRLMYISFTTIENIDLLFLHWYIFKRFCRILLFIYLLKHNYLKIGCTLMLLNNFQIWQDTLWKWPLQGFSAIRRHKSTQYNTAQYIWNFSRINLINLKRKYLFSCHNNFKAYCTL